MAYAAVQDVQDRLPTQLWEGSPVSQPTLAVVAGWLEADSRMIEGALRWKYDVPISDPTDAATLREANADLTAARVWQVIAGHQPQYADMAAALRKMGLQAIGYDAKTGRALLVLPNSPLSDSGEAAVDSAEATFTDPLSTDESTVPRIFTMGMEY